MMLRELRSNTMKRERFSRPNQQRDYRNVIVATNNLS